MITRQSRRAGWLALALVFALGLSVRAQAQDLKSYNVDPASITVSGISSGGFMAHQLHIAFSKTIKGAGIVAGGPFHCASAWSAIFGPMGFANCMCLKGVGVCNDLANVMVPSVDVLSGFIRPVSGVVIDDIKNLADSKVYVFRGTKDTLVRQVISDTVVDLYKALGVNPANIVNDNSFPAGHSMPTPDYGIACETEGTPFVNKCGDDVAGKILSHLYGQLKPRAETTAEPVAFAQAPFVDKGQNERWGVHAEGHIYVPKACKSGKTECKLHVALHGCGQTQDDIKADYYAHAGYNEWAETNKIIVLYPQAKKIPVGASGDMLRANPYGCWDWWGYTEPNTYYKRYGKQMSAIAGMIEKVAGVTIER